MFTQCYLLGRTDPLLEIAMELEKMAMSDEYFKSRNLYPNVDFYSGKHADLPDQAFHDMAKCPADEHVPMKRNCVACLGGACVNVHGKKPNSHARRSVHTCERG